MQVGFNLINRYDDTDCFSMDNQPDVECDLPRDSTIKRILIIKWGGMGDIVISTAIMQDIYNAFPHAEIHLNTMPAWQGLFAHDARFKLVWTVDLRKKERGIKGMFRWLKAVKQYQYDLIIDLQTNDKSRLLLSLLRLTGQAPKYLLGNHGVYPYTIKQKQDWSAFHGFKIMRQTLAIAGIPANMTMPVIYSSDINRQRATKLLNDAGLLNQPFAIFLCGTHAAGLTKRWGVENYANLSVYLAQKGIHKIVLVGGPDEIEECKAIAQIHPDTIVNLCGKTALLDLPEIFKLARLIVANDTGTAHLAAASQTPMLVITGPTNPLRVKPIGSHVIAIQPEINCKNCYLKTCSHHSCMKGLTADRVVAYLESCL